MAFDLDDPKLTAYALGELDEAERAEVEAQLGNDPAAQRQVGELRLTVQHITDALQRDLAAQPLAPEVAVTRRRRIEQDRRWVPWAIAASIVLLVGSSSLLLVRSTPAERRLAQTRQPSATSEVPATEREVVHGHVQKAQELVKEGKYEQAAALTDEILKLDPQNEYAQAARPLIEDRARFLQQRLYRQDFDRELTRALNAEEQRVPYNDILRIPSNWPALSENGRETQHAAATPRWRRESLSTHNAVDSGDSVLMPADHSGAVGQVEAPSDAAVASQLARRIPEVRLENSSFSDVIDYLRDVTGANIVVDWRALEEIGITRTTPIMLRMRDAKFSDVMRSVLDNVQPAGVKIHVSVHDSMITISPREGPPEFNTESYDRITDNPFLDSMQNPLSTFSIDVDTASYSNVRRFLNQGKLPPKNAVRIEEMLNYFTYDYAAPLPEGEAPFSSNVEIASCPWSPQHRLVRVALKGKEIAREERPDSNIVFLIDVSGSMQPPNKLPLLKRAMAMLVDQLGERDRVAIAVYAGSSGLVLPPTLCDPRQKESIQNALAMLESGGSTNGAQGIELAYKVAAENFIKGGTNRVILCTDGDFNVGITDEGALTRLIEDKAKTGVFLSVLGFGMGNVKDSTMEKLSDTGNGNYAYIDTMEEARKVLVEQMSGTLVTIAKDVKIQVEFNPARVAAYRLIGYENRMLAKEDFNDDKKDAGEIGAGHTVTALYEIVPTPDDQNLTPDQRRERARQKFTQAASRRREGAGGDSAGHAVDPLKYQKPAELTDAAKGDDMLTLKLRYKEPDGQTSKLLEFPVQDNGTVYAQASSDFKFAASVAAFGMILRDSPYKGQATLDAVLKLAHEGKAADTSGYRAEFIALVTKAKALLR